MSAQTLAEMIAGSFRELHEGSIVKGRILEIKPQVVLVDIGYKSEGAIPANEFEDEDIQVGDEIEVLLEKLENDEGMVVLSKEKAAYKQNWEKIASVFRDGGLVKARSNPSSKVASWSTSASKPSCPGSQVDIIPPKDLNEYVGNIYEFKIVKVNDERKNIVLSRREVIEAERAELRQQFLRTASRWATRSPARSRTSPTSVRSSTCKGMDGLLHITDMSWGRINHPSEMLIIGQPSGRRQILDVDREKERVSLGLKQMSKQPMGRHRSASFASRFQNVKGKVTKLLRIRRVHVRLEARC